MSRALLARHVAGLGLAALLACLAAPAPAQEAVADFGNGPTPFLVRSTTDIAILAPAMQAFADAHPDLAIRYQQWGSNALYDRTRADCHGAAVPADAVLSSGVHQMVDLVNSACARPYRSGLTAPLPAARRWRDELWGVTREAAVIVYNRALVPEDEVPRSRFALLDLMRQRPDRYRGRIATYDIEASGLGYLFAFADSQEATTYGALLEAFSRTDAVTTCCSAEIIEGVETGQYLIAYNVLGSYVDNVPSPDLGVVLPEDYTLFLSRAYMIPRQARQPQAAERLLDFLLSPAGQDMLTRSHLVAVPDGESDALPESAARSIAIEPTLLVALDRQRQAQFIDEWRDAFGPVQEP